MPRKPILKAPSPRDRAREARNDVYRQHILDAAEAVFADAGFEAAKLQDISKRAELSMGTIYAIFPGKTELLAAIRDLRGQELLELARAICDSPLPAPEALERLVTGYTEYFADHPTFLRMHLRQGGSWVLTPGGQDDGRARIWNEIHATQARLFRRGAEGGAFVREDPGFLAKVFSALDQVVMAEWVAGGMKQDRVALARRLHDLVWRAVRPR